MEPITYLDRETKVLKDEHVYYGEILQFLYGNSYLSKIAGRPLVHVISRFPFVSSIFGWWNSLAISKKKILPFIERYHIDPEEFEKPLQAFTSFNDFFTRKLKQGVRPIKTNAGTAIIPADGRYLVYPDIQQSEGFLVKGQKFCLYSLLGDKNLAETYENGAMVIARLCPTDYHRYHFPVDCHPEKSQLINGTWYSVNPVAIKQNIHILTSNKRMMCKLKSKQCGTVLFIEVGATNVGSIHQTYTPEKAYCKGDEKGYFSFGASTLILLFEPGAITFDKDLLNASAKKIEVRCLMGQSLGTLPLSSTANLRQ